MSSNCEVTGYVYRAILSQLVDIEERKEEMVNEYYEESAAMRDEFSNLMDEYLKKLEELIRAVQIVDRPSREQLRQLNYLPYAIIGSTVELEDTKSLNTHLFKIVSPYDISNVKMDISYLSALGRLLLLKKPCDIITAKIDKCTYTFKIKSVRYES